MILLDTSVLISGTWPDQAQVGASILSRAELEFGVAVAANPQTRASRTARLEALDQMLEWLPFEAADSRCYGIVAAALHGEAPAKARRTDAFIAAQALRHGASLMTHNTAGFTRLSHLLEVLAPGQAPNTP